MAKNKSSTTDSSTKASKKTHVDKETSPDPEVVETDVRAASADGDMAEPEILDAETITVEADSMSDAPRRGWLSPGVILLGVLALVSILILLAQSKKSLPTANAPQEEIVAAPTDQPSTAARDATDPVAASMATQSAALNQIEQLSRGPDAAPVVVPANAARAADEAEATRNRAMERARARREARAAQAAPEIEAADASAVNETANPSTDNAPANDASNVIAAMTGAATTEDPKTVPEAATEPQASLLEMAEETIADLKQTDPTDPPAIAPTSDIPNAPASAPDSAPNSAAEKIANTASTGISKDAFAQSQQQLAQERQLRQQQSEEISQLRTEFDTALAEQEQRSQQRLAELDQRLSKIQNQDVAAATKQATISIALNKLQTQMMTGRPFKDELAVLQKLTNSTAEIRALEPYSDKGLPTMTYLQQTFREASRKALAAAQKDSSRRGVGKLFSNVKGLFTVRKRGNVSGDTPSAIISRAEYQLEQNNLSNALTELEALSGDGADALANWISLAKARASGDTLLDNISNGILAGLR